MDRAPSALPSPAGEWQLHAAADVHASSTSGLTALVRLIARQAAAEYYRAMQIEPNPPQD